MRQSDVVGLFRRMPRQETLSGSSGLLPCFRQDQCTHTPRLQLPYEEMVRIRPTLLLGLAALLFGCAEQPTGHGSYDGPESPGSLYPAYGYSPGYLGPNYYGSDVVLGGGGYWAGGNDRDPYWYRHRGKAWQRDGSEAQARAQAWQQLQQQKATVQAAQIQAAVQQQQAAQQQAALAAQAVQQQRAAAQAVQARALQERAQAVQQMYQQRAQMLAAQQQAIAAARARQLAQ